MSIKVLDSNDRPSGIILNSSLSIRDNVSYTVVIAENSPSGTSLTNLSVVDEDVGQQHRCMLIEGGNKFYISSLSKSSSEIRVKQGANLDYESLRGTPLQRMYCFGYVHTFVRQPTSFPGSDEGLELSYCYTVAPPCATTSRERPPSISDCNLVPRVLSYPPHGARERERDPGKRWSRGSRPKLILREESFVSHFLCPVYSQRGRNSKIDLPTLLQL